MATRMQQRRGTATEWSSVNPVLSDGEIGFERDTGLIKVGDGVAVWSSLKQPFVRKAGGDEIVASGVGVIPLSLKLAVGQTASALDIKNSANSSLASVDSVGAFRGNAFAAGGLIQAGTTVLDSAQQMLASIGSDSRKGLVIRMASAQSANVFEVQTSAGATRTALTAKGHLNLDEYAPGQTDASIRARRAGNSFEFGHGNQAGYGSVIGAENGSGMPVLVFLGEIGTISNKYTSRGFPSVVIRPTSGGDLDISTVPANGVNVDSVRKVRIASDGQYRINPDAADVYAGRAVFGADPYVRRMQMTGAADYGGSLSILAGVYGGTGAPGIVIRSGAGAHDGAGSFIIQDSAFRSGFVVEPIGRTRVGTGTNAAGIGIGSAGGGQPLDRPMLAFTNVGANPANFGGGGSLFTESGRLYYKGELGSLTQLASA